MRLVRSVSAAFTAGVVGGLCNALAVWGSGRLGIPAALGVDLAPAFTIPWLNGRMVWGGLWGLLFALPLFPRSPRRGLILSFAPTLVTLLVVFPLRMKKAFFGLELGLMTPVLVLVYNLVWGFAAGAWHQRAK